MTTIPDRAPWIAGPYTNDRAFNSIDAGRFSFICHPAPTNPDQVHEVQATATMLSAALDLHDAVTALLCGIDDFDDHIPSEFISMARAALSKSRGES